MNVATITMDPAEAREKLRAVRARLHRSADAEYKALEVGYAALAKGTPLIHLPDSMRMGGIGPDSRPRFAFARADRKRVRFHWSMTTASFDAHLLDRWGSRRGGHKSPELLRTFDFAGVEGLPHQPWTVTDATALVPMVPPDIRSEDPGDLKQRWILWEVEKWEPVPPRDPMLLQHVGGDLYAVTGAWDLTELERAVMAGRRNA